MPVGSRNKLVLLFPWCTKKWNSSLTLRFVKGKGRVSEQGPLWLGRRWSPAGGRGQPRRHFQGFDVTQRWGLCSAEQRDWHRILQVWKSFLMATNVHALYFFFHFCLTHLEFFRSGTNTCSLRYIFIKVYISR